MPNLKIFIVGPHVPRRYEVIKGYVEAVFAEAKPASAATLAVVHPAMNPPTDRFNDWIFGQIDTCDLLIADVTNFNANVVYEIAFAHSLGLPCIYLRFSEDTSPPGETRAILHYFKTSLLIDTSETALIQRQVPAFEEHLRRFLSGGELSGKTILSDYYGGVAPIDAEFMRGLAEGYFRNFLGCVLAREYEPPEKYDSTEFYIAIPDTFETYDQTIDDTIKSRLPGTYEKWGARNTLGREIGVNYNAERNILFDVPTTVLTVTQSSKYKKIAGTGHYFTAVDRDKLTDILARKFVTALWATIMDNRRNVNSLARRMRFVWLSEIVGNWTENESLMNSTPFTRPDGF